MISSDSNPPASASTSPAAEAPSEDKFTPIAIIGLALRLPGGISTPTQFWDLLINKKDGKCRVPASRYNIDAFHSQDDKAGDQQQQRVASDHGYFLDHVNLKAFDAAFFSAKRTEVEVTDPQQRLLLEVAWECVESAGQTTGLRGSRTGVYVGVFGEDWHNMLHRDEQVFSAYRVLSAGDYALANRLSYEMDFRGPSMTIRTACSASLSGLHLACQALRSGDCETALVAGSSLIMDPAMTLDMSQQGVLSPTGSCKTFDAAADGFARGEAINAILIKPLDQALRDGDPIRAVIRSTAVNSDGKTSHLGSPSTESQEQMIRRAYEAAGIEDFSRTPFFECHGTGTAVGDPLEVAAVGNVFGQHQTYIGSVKPNVGHGEGASGLTSIIKAVLALENKTIPPNINFVTPNPKIPFQKYNLEVPVEPIPWPEDRYARISVNSFGIGGANAHVIIDSAVPFHSRTPSKLIETPPRINGTVEMTQEPERLRQWLHVLPISASSASSLQARVEDLKVYIESHPGCLDDIVYSMALRRTHLPFRSFCLVEDGPVDSLQFSSAVKPSTMMGSSSSIRKPVYIFTGQGAQWAGMAKSLMLSSQSFRKDIQSMDKTLQSLGNRPSWTFEALLSTDNDDVGDLINKAEYSQPLCTAVQIALVNLLTRCGVTPSAVVGHSSGEIAAAYTAGLLTEENAILCAYHRGQAVKRQNKKGSMAAIGLGSLAVQEYLAAGAGIACENSPTSVTISGDADAVHETLEAIKSDEPDVFTRLLHLDVAYHSHHMQETGEAYEMSLSSLLGPSLEEDRLPFYSTVTGQLGENNQELGPAYWRQNLESPVLFHQAVNKLLLDMPDVQTLLEIGPHSALQAPLRQILQASQSKQKPTYLPTLLRDRDPLTSLLNTIGHLWVGGHRVDFSFVNPPGTLLTDLPTYPWNHEKEFWKESRMSEAWRQRKHAHHELLGSLCPESTDLQWSWRNVFHESDVPWLRDHKVGTDIVFPCAGYIAMMGEAIRQISGSDAYTIRNLMVKSALVLPDIETTEMMTSLRPSRVTEHVSSPHWFDISISTFNGETWVENCAAQGRASDPQDQDKPDTTKHISSHPRHISPEYFYEKMANLGLKYGPQFRGLGEISAHVEKNIASASIKTDRGEPKVRYAAHPTAIDFCLQLCAVAGCKGIARHMETLVLPVDIRNITVSPTTSAELLVEAALSPVDAVGHAIAASKDNGRVGISLAGIKGIPFDIGDLPKKHQVFDLARLEWRPHIDYQDPSNLIRRHHGKRDMRILLEKLASLSVLQTLQIVRSMNSKPTGHLEKYVAWMEHEKQRMALGHQKHVFPEREAWCALAWEAWNPLMMSIVEAVEGGGELAATNTAKMVYDSAQPETVTQIFSGTMNPLQVFLDDGRLGEFYRFPTSFINTEDFFRLCSHAQPNMRVLEIGAGTGSTTEMILPTMESQDGIRMYDQYVFTDISPGFFDAARERFKSKGGMEYKVLDIEKDPIEQGFEAGSFDLVVASNVLHATKSLHRTLVNVRKLLRDGGRLYLGELAEPHDGPLVPFLMGRLPGWWIGDEDGRPDAPFVGIERWDRELKAAGFSGTDAAVLDEEPPYQNCAHMTSRAISSETSGPEQEEVILLYKEEKAEFGQHLETVLLEQGFIVHWNKLGDDLQHHQSDSKNIISLIDLEQPFFDEITETEYLTFTKYLGNLNGGIMWLTRNTQIECTNPRYGIVNGVARTVRVELSKDFWTVELHTLDADALKAALSLCQRFCTREPLSRGQDTEFMVRGGVIHVGRYHWTSLPAAIEPPLLGGGCRQMVIGQYGLLDSVRWLQHERPVLRDDEVEVEIRCVGLNFRDIMVAIGIVPKSKDQLGCEAAGVVTRVGPAVTHVKEGDRVFAVYNGLFATHKAIPGRCVAKMPETLSFEEAVTMPIVYLTVIYAVITLGQLRKGQSILIHSGTGGVGQAAINICQMIGADIFVTVGNLEKTNYLISHHGIPRSRIFDSHSPSFHADVMRATAGRGVDLVLNSLSGELLHASWQCVAPCGKMMEIGKRDILEHGRLALDMFGQNRTFHGVDMESLMEERPELFQTLIDELIRISSNQTAKPILPIHAFPATKIADAFRFMKKGTHIGKIVITIPHDHDEIKAIRAPEASLLSATATYLVVGGLGGLGKAATRWMVEKGARNFVFLSRSAGVCPKGQAFLDELAVQGCTAIPVAGSVAEMEDVQKAVELAPTPIAGVLQMSMVIRDRAVLQMSYEDWRVVQDCKVKGTWNLHHALSKTELDFFILMSSISASVGHPGQTNYSSANTFLDSFAQYRHSVGLPCSVINLGGVEGIGFLSERPTKLNLYRAHGLHILHEQHLVDAIQLAIKQSAPLPNDATASTGLYGPLVTPNQFVVGLNTSKPLSDPKNRTLYKGEPRVCLYNNIAVADPSDSVDGRDDGLRELLSQAEANPAILDDPETLQRISWEIGRTLFSFLLLSEENLDTSLSLTSIGIDSLVSIEIRNWWRKILGLDITVLEITNAGTIMGLGKLAVLSLKEKYGLKEHEDEPKDQD